MKIGRRLAIKVLNASKFALGVIGEHAVPDDPASTTIDAPLDRALLAALADLVDDATAAFAQYDYARALERTERFFWGYCDDYIELVKQRGYDDADDVAGAASARATLAFALDTLLRLFAPHLPFVTEEVWSWWREGSVHRSAWPESAPLRAAAAGEDPAAYAVAADVLGEVRKAKTTQQKSMRADVASATVVDRAERLALLATVATDVCAAGRVAELRTEPGEVLTVEVVLAESA